VSVKLLLDYTNLRRKTLRYSISLTYNHDMKILLTGGAGYIGSHTAWEAIDSGIEVVIIDDLSTGVRENCPKNATFYEGDVGDAVLLDQIFYENTFDAVIHFAGSIVVSESVKDPLKYYDNNVSKSVVLIEACLRHDVRNFLFSSSAAVYGEPDSDTVYEDTPKQPINPYGWSKLMVEKILQDASVAHGLRFGALRYFNVAGADQKGRTGESPPDATHLVKIAAQHATGLRDQIYIFGDDYPTPDGTCIRDYIHVTDLARAHLSVLSAIEKRDENLILNCGIGDGFSVKEVLETVEKAAGKKLNIIPGPKRAGDPPRLVSNADRLREVTDWEPQYDDIEEMARTAIMWEEILAKRSRSS